MSLSLVDRLLAVWILLAMVGVTSANVEVETLNSRHLRLDLLCGLVSDVRH